jgi:CheY-like chemotaxis protein
MAATILVVDDDPRTRELARSTLQDAGFRVLIAATGAQAIEIYTCDQPDCILLGSGRSPAARWSRSCS